MLGSNRFIVLNIVFLLAIHIFSSPRWKTMSSLKKVLNPMSILMLFSSWVCVTQLLHIYRIRWWNAWLTYLRKCYIEGGMGRTAREKPTHRKKKAAIFHKKLILTIHFTPTNVLIQFEFGSHVSIPSLHSSISSHFCLYFCACSRPTPDGALPR